MMGGAFEAGLGSASSTHRPIILVVMPENRITEVGCCMGASQPASAENGLLGMVLWRLLFSTVSTIR